MVCPARRLLLAALLLAHACAAEEETIVVAAGCFWSIELAYQRVPGVLSAVA